MFRKKLLFSVFNTALRSYTTKLLIFNNNHQSYSIIAKKDKKCTFLLSFKQFSNTTTYEEIKSVKNNKNVLLIDVREPDELQETGKIPGSINIPLGDVENILKNLPKEEFKKKYGREKPEFESAIIFSCRSGKRSAMAQEIAQKLGYCNVQNYLGGWLDWEEKNK